jgi:hypothetical protein
MGNERQFEDLFLPFLNAAYSLALWIVHNEQDAQDVVQEAYLRAFKGGNRPGSLSRSSQKTTGVCSWRSVGSCSTTSTLTTKAGVGEVVAQESAIFRLAD